MKRGLNKKELSTVAGGNDLIKEMENEISSAIFWGASQDDVNNIINKYVILAYKEIFRHGSGVYYEPSSIIKHGTDYAKEQFEKIEKMYQ